jgi:two-component system, response regulator YesN
MEMGPMSRVLLVEDNPIYRMVFHQQFKEHFPAAVIDVAGSGDEALQKIRQAPPDLVILDLRLPGMDGLELSRKIKRDFPNIRIAILTGYDSQEYREVARQVGVDRFFVKESLQWDELLEFAKSILYQDMP